MTQLSPTLKRQWQVLLVLVPAVNAAAIAAVVVYHWPNPADGFGGRFERNLMSWFTSVELVLAGFTAGLVFLLERAGRPSDPRRAGSSWIWAAFALGCGFLGVDEYAELHERIDDRLAELLLPGTSQPPFVLAGCLLLGLVPALVLLKEWRREKAVAGWFVTAIVLSALAIFFDVFTASAPRLDVARRVAEDCLELVAAAAFLLAFLRAVLNRVQALAESSGNSAVD
jgi:hypothetical protein